MMGGVWANFARVSHSPYEFTIDFARLEFQPMPEGVPDGVVVARVSMAPLLVEQLRAALTDNWDKWQRKAMPPEVYADDREEGPGGGKRAQRADGGSDAPPEDE
jgi:hypothetical protein